MGNELKKLFLKWFTEGYYVDEDKVKIRLKNYMIPGRSTVRYTDINIKNILFNNCLCGFFDYFILW